MDHNRKTKKPHRRSLLAGFLVIILLLFGIYSVTSFFKDKSVPSTEAVRPQMTLTEDIQLAWPEVGQAAVGSVEDGLLARSSLNEKQRPIASMAKVITALAIMEKRPFEPGQEGQTITITKEDIDSMVAYISEEGSVQPLLVGTKLTQYQAMQRMLIASDNNMADILVERIFGSREAYVSYANDMLRRMKQSQTVVDDASGFSPQTVSTPSDMVALGIAALKNPVIAEIVAQPQAQILGDRYPIYKNTNELLGEDGVIGIKTGITREAGGCLLFAARFTTKDGKEKTIVGVVMGSGDAASRFNESRELLASARQSFGLAEAEPTDNTIATTQENMDRAPRQLLRSNR